MKTDRAFAAMLDASDRIPPILGHNGDDERTHVFFIHSPIALIMTMMIVDAYGIRQDRVLAVSERSMNTGISGFATVPLKPREYDRYFNKLSGRNLGAMRLSRMLKADGQKFVVYASWFYSAIEEITKSKLCDGVVIFEEGQLSYHPAVPYKDILFNTWRFRRKRLFGGTTDFWFRRDADAYISLTPEAFPAIPEEQRYVLRNISAAARAYTPLLDGIRSIGLMPAPRRLPPSAVFPAVEKLIQAIPDRGVIRPHPGYRFEKYYSVEQFTKFIDNASSGRITLCPDEAIIELEMAREKKVLYGAQTSLSRYASVFGSRFAEVSFDQYIRPVI